MRSPILFYTLMASNVMSNQPAKMFTEANYITLTTEHKRVTIIIYYKNRTRSTE